MESSQDFLEKDKLDAFVQIVNIGHLSKTFEWFGHKFEIRTLSIEEELAIGQLVKEYKDSITEEKAVAVAIAAASLISINDRLFKPRFDENAIVESIKDKFIYIKKNWHWPVVERINTGYLELLGEMYETIEETQNL